MTADVPTDADIEAWGNEPSGLTLSQVAERASQAFSDGYSAGKAAERERRNARRRKPRRSTLITPTMGLPR